MARPLTLDLGVPSFLNRIFEAKPAGLALKDALCIIRHLGAWKWRLREVVGLVAALHTSIEQWSERNLGKDCLSSHDLSKQPISVLTLLSVR